MTVASTFARRRRAAHGTREGTDVAVRAAQIELSGVTKRFVTPSGSMFTALRDVDLTIGPGKFCAVVGPTGCGKSTTLTMVAGLDRPSAGTVRVGGQAVDGITTGTSFMFQADALMPWKTVLGNVALGPEFRGVPKKLAQDQAREWVCRVGRGTGKAVCDIALPRPGGAVQEIRFPPRFLELHHQIWESLREEVQRAYARTTATAEGGQS